MIIEVTVSKTATENLITALHLKKENLMSKKQDLITRLNALNDNASLTDLDKVITDFFKNESEYRPWRSKAGRYVFAASLTLAAITMGLTLFTCYMTPILICYACWTILPPGWFMYEYVRLFPDYHKFNPSQMTDLKYVHELAGKIWAGMVLIIGLVILYKFHIKLHLP